MKEAWYRACGEAAEAPRLRQGEVGREQAQQVRVLAELAVTTP